MRNPISVLLIALVLLINADLQAQCTTVTISSQPTNVSACAGNDLSFWVNSPNASAFQWYESTDGGTTWVPLTNNTVFSGVTTGGLTLTYVPASYNTYQFRCLLSNACSNVYSQSAILTVRPMLTPTVTITGPATTCPGVYGWFTATVTNAGANPTFQWLADGTDIAGTNYNPIGLTAPAGAWNISCEVIASSDACTITPNVTSNILYFYINRPSVTITQTSPSPACQGTTATFTSTVTDGGTSPTYQWAVNGTAIPGATNSTWSTSTLLNGQKVTCVVTANNGCTTNSTTSNAITMAINPIVTPTITITSSAPASCANTNVTFTATVTGGGLNPGFQWQADGTNIPPSAGNTHGNPEQLSFSARGNFNITCVLTPSTDACSSEPSVTSNAVPWTILVPAITITQTSPSPSCQGSTTTFTSSVTDGGPSPTYQWRVNGTPINGATAATYSSPTLLNGDQVTCEVTGSGACMNTGTSNSITMAINPVLTPAVSITASATTICAGATPTFTATPTNGGPTPGYQWEINNAAITGATNPTFSPSTPLNNGDEITCKLNSNATCVSPTSTTSTPLTITVNPIVTPAVSITASTTTICAGTSVYFTATPTSGGNNPAYQWTVNGSPMGSDATFASNTLANGDIIQCQLTSSTACAVNPAYSNKLTEQVFPVVTSGVTVAASSTDICAGTQVTFTARPTNGGTKPVYQWLLNGNYIGPNSPTWSTNTLKNGDEISVDLTSSLNCSSSASSGSPILITVRPLPVVTMMADTVIRQGSSALLHADVAGTITGYRWTPTTGLDNPAMATPLASPQQTTAYDLTVTDNTGCVASGEVTVQVFYPLQLPNAFTPNGDGNNDVFRIPPSNRVNIRSFVVFDRWGTRVFTTQNSAAGWDGTMGGHQQPTGVYVYLIEYQDPISRQWLDVKGTVMLIR